MRRVLIFGYGSYDGCSQQGRAYPCVCNMEGAIRLSGRVIRTSVYN